MGAKESSISTSIMKSLSKMGVRLFRNNVGKCWIGSSKRYNRKTVVTVEPGDVVVRKARRFNAGLFVGSGDLIGWTPIVVTQEMVGSEVAVFTSLEVKTAKGRRSEAQAVWGDAVKNAGGKSGVARSDDDAVEIVGSG